MYRKIRKGFTIVELVIVIAVIAVLTAVLVPTFVHLSKKAKAASDQSLVANLNTALKMEQGETGKTPKTMHDAVEGLYNQGYVLDNLVTKSEQDLVYSLAENKFYLSGEVTASSDYWHIYKWDQIPSTQTWSIYASGSWGNMTGAKELKVGFDAGDTSGKYNLAFNNSAEGVKAVIRTNSADTNLSVYAPNGSIEHHGYVGSLEIIAVKDGSYHEYGSAGFAEINKGRIVLESDSEIKHIHINANSTSTGFEAVVIEDKGAEALPQAITRDEITLNSGSVDVVTVVSSGSEEVVKVYSDGSTGSTQKTETQNAAVASALGQLVLDNGASEKKALDEDAKEEAKAEAVDELAGEEVSESENISSYVARIGTQGYMTFQDAYGAAASGNKIVLLKSVVLGDSVEGNFVQEEWTTSFKFNKAGITLDLNGNSLVCTATDSYLIGFYIEANADLTIKDSAGGGKISAPRAVTVIYCVGTINVYGGTIQADFYDEYGAAEALRVNGTANIYGGKFISGTYDYYCFAVNNCGTTNIYGGQFETPTAYYSGGLANSGNLNIKASISLESFYWDGGKLTVDSGKVFATSFITLNKKSNMSVDGSGTAQYGNNSISAKLSAMANNDWYCSAE